MIEASNSSLSSFPTSSYTIVGSLLSKIERVRKELFMALLGHADDKTISGATNVDGQF